MPTEEPKLVTTTTAAFLVGVPRRIVSDWVKRGEIWSLGREHGTSGNPTYSLRRCRELASIYHARKARLQSNKRA